jgi:hypothetical protein
VLDAAGLPIPEAMMGRSLIGGAPPPAAAFAEEDHEGNVLHALRTTSHKLILANEDNPRGLPAEALFDLGADPGEQQDLVASQAERAQVLSQLLRETLALALEHAVAGETGEVDAALQEKLRDLGY